LKRCQSEAKVLKRKFRFKHKLLSLDPTVIPLCLSVFDWARYKRAKGAVKLHMVLDHDGYLPSYAVVTDGKTADITAAKRMTFAPDTMLVFAPRLRGSQLVAAVDAAESPLRHAPQGQRRVWHR
jgi:hypothetical protein